MKKLAIVSSHPIQYNAPLFKLLATNGIISIKVFYTWGKAVLQNKEDPGFGRVVEWDIPLLEGYEYSFIENIAAHPGSHHFSGIVNPGLNDEIKQWGAEAVLVFGWSFHSHLKCLRYFHHKIPVLFRGDSTLLDETAGFKQQLRRLLLRWVYKHIDLAFYVGENNRQYFLAHGLKPTQLVYAPHAIDNERFAQPDDLYQAEAASIKQSLGVTETDLLLLFAGKFETKKNPFYLLKLLKDIPDRRFKILFAGSGILSPGLKAAAEKDSRVLLMDFQNQQLMPAIYRTADLFVLPSQGPGETWGLALNEAMAAGTAVAATNKAGGALDLIEQGINGLVIDLLDDGPMLNFIRSALKDKSQLKEMGRLSANKIQSFTFNHIAKAIEETVLQLQTGASRRNR